MRILITNDDGINAPGLEVLTDHRRRDRRPRRRGLDRRPRLRTIRRRPLHQLHPSDDDRRSWTRAAMPPRAARPIACWRRSTTCLQGARPDLVLSGVNRGNNAAENVLYSGTIGGAMEAALQGVPAIALSQFIGPGNRRPGRPVRGGARPRRRAWCARCWTTGSGTRATTGCSTTSTSRPSPAADVKGMQGRRRRASAATPPSGSSRISRPRGASSCGSRAGRSTRPPLPGTDVGGQPRRLHLGHADARRPDRA